LARSGITESLSEAGKVADRRGLRAKADQDILDLGSSRIHSHSQLWVINCDLLHLVPLSWRRSLASPVPPSPLRSSLPPPRQVSLSSHTDQTVSGTRALARWCRR